MIDLDSLVARLSTYRSQSRHDDDDDDDDMVWTFASWTPAICWILNSLGIQRNIIHVLFGSTKKRCFTAGLCSSVYGVLLGVRIWGEKGKIWIKKCRIMAVTIRG